MSGDIYEDGESEGKYDLNEVIARDLQDIFFAYNKSLSVCDPLDYKIRQRDLLYAICEYLLRPTEKKRDK